MPVAPRSLSLSLLNASLVEGSLGERWTPRINQRQLDAICAAVSGAVYEIDADRLDCCVRTGDRAQLAAAERATLENLTRQAKQHAVTPDDVKRMWPRKIAVVLRALRARPPA